MINLLKKYGILLWLLMFANLSYGAVYKYQYYGANMDLDSYWEDYDGWSTPPPAILPGYRGTILIDESALPGGSLVNADVSFDLISCDWALDCDTSGYIATSYGPYSTTSRLDGLIGFDMFENGQAFLADLSFVTNSDRDIVAWVGSFFYGFPDGGISNITGDFYDVGTATWINDIPGKWSAPVLVPEINASSMPLALSLLLLGVLAIREHRRFYHYTNASMISA